MTRVFISFPKTALPIGQELIARFMERNIDFVYTEPGLMGGALSESVNAEIRNSDVLLVFAAAAEFNPNTLLEIGYAIGIGKHVALVSSGTAAQVPRALEALPLFIANNERGWVDRLIEFIKSAPSTRAADKHEFKSTREELCSLLESPESLERLSPTRFELLICNYLKDALPKDEVRVLAELGHYDILVEDIRHGLTYAFELKKHGTQTYMGVGDIHRFIGRIDPRTADMAIIITTGQYTRAANALAIDSPVPLRLYTLVEFLNVPQSKLLEAFRNPSGQA
jgi:hypothetical protein